MEVQEKVSVRKSRQSHFLIHTLFWHSLSHGRRPYSGRGPPTLFGLTCTVEDAAKGRGFSTQYDQTFDCILLGSQ